MNKKLKKVVKKTGNMSSLLPTFLEIQNVEIYKNVQTLNKYHMPQYYCVNMFKFLLSERKVRGVIDKFAEFSSH